GFGFLFDLAESHLRAVCPSESVTTTQASRTWSYPAVAVAVPLLLELVTAPVTDTVVARPLSFVASHANVTSWSPPFAVSDGTGGGQRGLTAPEAADQSAQMYALHARTWNVYDVPLVRPGYVYGVTLPAFCPAMPLALTSYRSPVPRTSPTRFQLTAARLLVLLPSFAVGLPGTSGVP